MNCAGWEIPAVLEQSLNSDLPGEIKALVMSNVYDRATAILLALDLRFLSIKRMPRINHLAYIGFMGLNPEIS